MRRKARTFIGTVATLGFVIVYALGVMVVAETGLVRQAPPLVQGFFFVTLGLAWILPLMPLITWMAKPDP